MQFLLQQFFWGKLSHILSDPNTAVFQTQQLNMLVRFVSAENQSDRRGLAIMDFVSFEPPEIKFQLAFVCCFELAEF